MQNAFVTTKNAAIHMKNIARFRRIGPQPQYDVGIFPVGHETYVLAVGLVRYHKAKLTSNAPRFGLGQRTQGKAQKINLLLCGRKQEIALITRHVCRREQITVRRSIITRATLDIMTRHQRSSIQIPRALQKICKFNGLITLHTRDGRFTSQITSNKIIDDRILETTFKIQNIVRNIKACRNTPRIMNILPGAAGSFAANGFAMVIELQRNANHIIASDF